MPRSSRNRRGFTTVELAVVIIIIGLMSVLILPKVRIDNSAVDTAARSLQLSLLSAQRDAVARGRNVIVRVNGAEHKVNIVWDDNGNGAIDGGEHSRPLMLPDAVRFQPPPGVPPLDDSQDLDYSSGVTVVLQRNGAANATHTIYLTSARSLAGAQPVEARAVRITRATGRPVWYAWTGTEWRRGS
ncbi:MAG: GspH/FimT family pseudopilin [Gemmatimonadaceae bacterium]|nr:GspH/FimT family pseudopilin [Gemmatimonadaceae bacterium]